MKRLVLSLVFLSLFSRAQDVTCYQGIDQYLHPTTGEVFKQANKWVKRTLDPKESKITEEVILDSGDGRLGIDEIEMGVSNSQFSLDAKTFHGSGRLIGPNWKWTAWYTELKLKNDYNMRIIDHLTDDGLVATAELYTPEGILLANIITKLKLDSCKNFDDTKNSLF